MGLIIMVSTHDPDVVSRLISTSIIATAIVMNHRRGCSRLVPVDFVAGVRIGRRW